MRVRFVLASWLCWPCAAAAAPEKIVTSEAPGAHVAVIDDGVVYASDDDGASYRAVHRVSGAPIFDAAIGADGTLYALRDGLLDVVRGGKVATHAAPEARRVAVSGPVVAVLREGAVDVSVDAGATFATRALPDPCAGCVADFRGAFDFTVAGRKALVTDTEMNTCGSLDVLEWQRLLEVGQGGALQRSVRVSRADYAAEWAFGAFGWMYGISYAHRVLAVSSAGAEPVRGIGPLAPTDRMFVAHNGRTTVAAIGSSLLELNGAEARVLEAHGKEVSLFAVDGAGRPLVYDGDALWRFSRVSGWKRIPLP